MARSDIHSLIRTWIETHGWPVHAGIIIGPTRCGIGTCRKKHAIARTYVTKGGTIVWAYERPCDINAPMGADRAKP